MALSTSKTKFYTVLFIFVMATRLSGSGALTTSVDVFFIHGYLSHGCSTERSWALLFFNDNSKIMNVWIHLFVRLVPCPMSKSPCNRPAIIASVYVLFEVILWGWQAWQLTHADSIMPRPMWTFFFYSGQRRPSSVVAWIVQLILLKGFNLVWRILIGVALAVVICFLLASKPLLHSMGDM